MSAIIKYFPVDNSVSDQPVLLNNGEASAKYSAANIFYTIPDEIKNKEIFNFAKFKLNNFNDTSNYKDIIATADKKINDNFVNGIYTKRIQSEYVNYTNSAISNFNLLFSDGNNDPYRSRVLTNGFSAAVVTNNQLPQASEVLVYNDHDAISQIYLILRNVPIQFERKQITDNIKLFKYPETVMTYEEAYSCLSSSTYIILNNGKTLDGITFYINKNISKDHAISTMESKKSWTAMINTCNGDNGFYYELSKKE